MIRLAVADLRDSWLSWLGVCLAFVVTNTMLVLSTTLLTTAGDPTAQQLLGADGSQLLSVYGISNISLSSLVGVAVIGASTSLVVVSRRGAIARLLLGGATPGQVSRLLTTQVAIVSLLAGVVGDLVALVSAQPLLDLISRDRGLALVPAVTSPVVLVATNLACMALCIVGGLRQSRAASRIPPVEALREAAGTTSRREGPVRTTLRGLLFLVYASAVAVTFPVFRASAPELGDDALGILMQLTMFAIPVTGLALTTILPWVCGGLTRLWTGAVPFRGASWHLARTTVIVKSDRLVRSIIPVMFSVGLLFGMMCVADTVVATLRTLGMPELDGTSTTTLLTTLGSGLVIAVAGSVGNLVMMSRQRSAELALAGVLGATPRQQLLVPALEAVIITVTASMLGLVMATVSGALLTWGLATLLPQAQLSLPWAVLGWSVLVCLVTVTLATMVPVVRSLRQPAPRVVNRLVAA